MKNSANEIRKAINEKGGLMSFSSRIRRERDSARPMRTNLIEELQELNNYELNVSFYLGLIGNNRRTGTIVKNSCRF